MTAPANITNTYVAILDALAKEVAAGNGESPAWLVTANRLVLVGEALVSVPDVPVALPGLIMTAQAMLDRVAQHAAASDQATAGRWLGHLEQLVEITHRMSAVGRGS